MNGQVVRVLVAVAIGGLVLAAAGCGGGKSTTTTEGASAGTTTATTETTTEATTTTGTGTTGALGALLSSKNCRELVTSATSFSQALSGAGGTDVKKAADLMKEFADKTPADIRPDFEVLADAYAKYAEALKGVDLTSGKTPSPEVIARLQKLSGEIDQAKLTQASQHITAWIQKNCTNGG
jgi:hypothetical protein